MDLLNDQRSLIYTGKLLRQPESGEWHGWTDLFVMLFDNYRALLEIPTLSYFQFESVIMTKTIEKDGVTKYKVTRRVSFFYSKTFII